MTTSVGFLASGFQWVHVLPLVERLHLGHVVTSLITLWLVYKLGEKAKAELEAEPDRPASRFSVRALFELITEFLVTTVRSVIPHHGEKYVPLLGGVFIWVLFSNLLALIPGFSPATDNISTNFAIALTVFGMYHYYGVQEHGSHYLKQFTGPLLAIAPLMLVIELIGHVFRPVTLSVRLAGNMMADHLVLGIFTDLVPYVVPLAFLMLGLIVCVIQAFVFFILSTVYIGLAVSHDH